MATQEAQFNGLQNPMILIRSNKVSASLPGFALWWERPRVIKTLGQGEHHLLTTASPLPSTRSSTTFPFTSLALSHWLHPAHFNLISLPHVPRPSADESGNYPLSDAGLLNQEMFPQDQNKRGEEITKWQESNLNTSPLNTVHALGWTLGFLCAPERILWWGTGRGCWCPWLHRKLHGNKDLWKVYTVCLGPRTLLHLHRYHCKFSVHLFPLFRPLKSKWREKFDFWFRICPQKNSRLSKWLKAVVLKRQLAAELPGGLWQHGLLGPEFLIQYI